MHRNTEFICKHLLELYIQQIGLFFNTPCACVSASVNASKYLGRSDNYRHLVVTIKLKSRCHGC